MNIEPNTVDSIDTNLYLGDKNAATDLELISKLELTHILSVDMVPLPHVVTSNFPNLATMQISVADMNQEDLLSHFEAAIKFIKEGITRGAILVHCYHGVSTSFFTILRHFASFWVTLNHFEAAIKSNKEGIKRAAILVHCYGVSTLYCVTFRHKA